MIFLSPRKKVRPPPHSPLEPLLVQIQIAKAAKYAKRFAKLNKLRNAWLENPEKKVFREKSHFMKYPVYFFLIFHISGKSMKQELLEMFQVSVQIFFILMKFEK